MNESDIKYKVQQKLADFDSIGSIHATETWNKSLMIRLDETSKHIPAGFSSSKLLIPILLLVLINLGFILNTMIKNSNKTSYHSSDLQAISNQLLINPTSLND